MQFHLSEKVFSFPIPQKRMRRCPNDTGTSHSYFFMNLMNLTTIYVLTPLSIYEKYDYIFMSFQFEFQFKWILWKWKLLQVLNYPIYWISNCNWLNDTCQNGYFHFSTVYDLNGMKFMWIAILIYLNRSRVLGVIFELKLLEKFQEFFSFSQKSRQNFLTS